MAKSSRSNAKDSSIHSRAARRAASPPDRTLTNITDHTSEPRPVKQFPAHHYGGVAKKKSKAKPLSRAQRLRRQKGMDRAEVVLDQLEAKTSSSIQRGKRTKTRRVAWEDLNSKLLQAARPSNDSTPSNEEDGWEDEEDAVEREQAEKEQEVIEGVEALHVDLAGDDGTLRPPDPAVADGAGGFADDDDEVL